MPRMRYMCERCAEPNQGTCPVCGEDDELIVFLPVDDEEDE